MSKIKTKEEALKKIAELPDKTVIRIAELSDNEIAMSYFSNPIKYALLKANLK